MKTIYENLLINVVSVPAAITTGTVPATYIDVADFERFAFLLLLGATDRTAMDFKIVQATAADGTGSKDVNGAAITQLGATDDNKWVMIEVQTDKLDLNNGFRYVSATYTGTGGAAATGAVIFLAANPGIAPVTQPAGFAQKVHVAG